MNIKPEEVLSKTLKGINAARSGKEISAAVLSVLRLVDGVKTVAQIMSAAESSGMPDAAVQAALQEMETCGLARQIERPSAAASNSVSAQVEKQLLDTLDFTNPAQIPLQKSAAAAAKPVAAGVVQGAAVQQGAATPADQEARARAARAARLKIETDIRQKLLVELQPRIEEDLRQKLRPRLEEELRPKLIAALRPGLEAEVRTALIKELTPRIELELKTRFAKTLAQQKAADDQTASETVVTPAPMPVSAPAAAADRGGSEIERVLASVSTPVFSVDKAGVCTFMSPAWAQFSGLAADEVIGKPLSAFFDGDSRRGISAMLVGICNGTALRFEQQGALGRKGGDSRWVEISAAPLYSSSGDLSGVCGVMRDAGESRRIAEQAEADGVRLLLLADQIDNGVILEDRDGNIQQVNPAMCALLSVNDAPYSLEGLPVSELLEQVSPEFMHPEKYLMRIADMRGAGEDVKGESLILADGRVLELDYIAVNVGEDIVGRIWLFREGRGRAAGASSVS